MQIIATLFVNWLAKKRAGFTERSIAGIEQLFHHTIDAAQSKAGLCFSANFFKAVTVRGDRILQKRQELHPPLRAHSLKLSAVAARSVSCALR